jgi:3-hydroxyisobutyryl-CoA hydrolase
MKSFVAMRRLQANLCFFPTLARRNFAENNLKNPSDLLEKYEGVLYKQTSKFVTEIILNQPKKLNSLDYRMVKNLLRRVRQWIPNTPEYTTSGEETDSEEAKKIGSHVPKVVIMTGAGEKSFCAGGDITNIYHLKKKGDIKGAKDFFRYEYLLDYSLTKIQPIQVSIWNGYVMGGGVGLSIHSPIRIATDNTLFAMPGIKFN